mgnify:CR=1 FL=1
MLQPYITAQAPTASDAAGGSSPARSRQLLVPTGTWAHPAYGRISIDDEAIRRYVQHYRDGVRVLGGADGAGRLPVTVEHDAAAGAVGWITDLEASPEGLVAEIEWTPGGAEQWASGARPYLSPELLPRYTDPRTGRSYERVLNGASLVVRPFFSELPQVAVQSAADPEPIGLMVFSDIERSQEDGMEEQTGQAALETMAAEVVATAPALTEVTAEPTAASAVAADEADDETVESGAQTAVSPVEARLAEMEAELAALRREKAVQAFSDALEVMRFGDAAGVPLRLAPAGRSALAEALADVPAALADRLVAALSSLQTYAEGEIGHGGGGASSAPVVLSEGDRSVARQLGLSEEDY